MPTYRVLKQGFRHGRLYHPQGRRPALVETTPFTDEKGENPKPSWVGDVIEPVKDGPTPAELQVIADQAADQERVTAEALASQTLAVREAADVGSIDFNIPNSEQAQTDKPSSGTTETLGT